MIGPSGAVMDASQTHRYVLSRVVEPEVKKWDRPVTFIMLNPSTADAVNDDPTIRKCRSYASKWGFPGLIVPLVSN